MPAYERLYDAPTVGVDVERAISIERQSWDTTKLLVVEEEEVPHPEKPGRKNKADAKIEPKQEISVDSPVGNQWDLTDEECRYLKLLLSDDRAGVRQLLAAHALMEEEIAEVINEKAILGMGDVLLEPGEDGYIVIADYIEEISQWIL